MKLEGVKVLDLSQFLPGPMLTLMMADHGADVIRIESPSGEPTRNIGYRKGEHTVWFRNTHRGKRSMVLNLRDEADYGRFIELAKQADVIVEAFRPGVVDRLKVDYQTISAINPGIVYASISAFGQTGRYRNNAAHDLAIQAMAGVASLGLGQDGKPAMPAMPSADAIASLTALSGVLMALLRRNTTGRGDYLDVSMMDSLLAWTPNVTGRVFATGLPHEPKMERSWGGNAMYNYYECADGRWLALGASEEKFAHNLLEGLGRMDLFPLACLEPGAGQEPLREFFRETFLTRTLDEWMEWFADRDVSVAPVRSLVDAFADPVVTEREMLSYDEEGSEIVGTPLRFTNEPARINPAVPKLNEHADAQF